MTVSVRVYVHLLACFWSACICVCVGGERECVFGITFSRHSVTDSVRACQCSAKETTAEGSDKDSRAPAEVNSSDGSRELRALSTRALTACV